MRLRLRIQRNELPVVSVLWPISNDHLKQTIAQLLQQVNERFPLEGETWGLDDYAVAIDGFEVLHYNELGQVCKDEDEVVIRPLQWADRKVRLLTGRDQIAPDGRHLLDGVPFGRPVLKRPRRPEVRIPPLKRQRRALEQAVNRSQEEEETQRVEEVDSDDDDEEDEYFDLDEIVEKDGTAEDSDSGSDTTSDGSSTTDESSEESSDDSSSESDREDSVSDDSWTGVSSNEDSREGQRSNQAALKPSWDQSENIVPVPQHQPYEGSQTTRNRNQRRRDQKKLKFLKHSGSLPPNATFEDLRSWRDINEQPHEQSSIHNTSTSAELEEKRQALLKSLAHVGGVDVTDPGNQVFEDDAAPREGVVEGGELSSTLSVDNQQTGGPAGTKRKRPETTESTSSPLRADSNRAPRLNAALTNRLIFGSLGLRVPKTQAEKDATQEKLAAQSKRKRNVELAAIGLENTIPVEELATDPACVEDPEDSESWRKQIQLSAVECLDEGVTLSTPPFPFRQRWDPQYQSKKKGRNSSSYAEPNKRQKKREKIGNDNNSYIETYDKYNKESNDDALNYDEEGNDDSYWEDGALLDRDNENEPDEVSKQIQAECAASEPRDDFPSLPADVSTLPTLSETDAAKGDFVIYQELACSAATEWRPSMLTRTAQLEDKSDGEWTVKLALRDVRPPKSFDDDGNRVYGKFEMEGFSDGEGDEGDEARTRTIAWSEMCEPKLLLRATTEEENA